MPLGVVSRAGTLLCVAMLAAGCSHPVRAGRNPTIRVSVTEYRLRPDSITAPAGVITLVVRNLGQLVHNLTVTDPDGHLRGATAPIAPGATQRLVLRLTRGTYTLASTIQSDAALGDRGTLTITPSH